MWGHSHVTPAALGEIFCRSLAALSPLPPSAASASSPVLPPCCAGAACSPQPLLPHGASLHEQQPRWAGRLKILPGEDPRGHVGHGRALSHLFFYYFFWVFPSSQQRLTEELQTMENGYHDNPTLEVMETCSEMQEKKVNLNGELGDSWIVPLDTIMKEDLEEEEDTHL